MSLPGEKKPWTDMWGTALVIAVGLGYILLVSLWHPVSGS